jgi:hypothetical protein
MSIAQELQRMMQQAEPRLATVRLVPGTYAGISEQYVSIEFYGRSNEEANARAVYNGSASLAEGDLVYVQQVRGEWVITGFRNSSGGTKYPAQRADSITSPTEELQIVSGATTLELTDTTATLTNGATTVNLLDAGLKVKVSSDDTTSGYLIDKLAAGSGIAITEANGGGNEDASIALDINGQTEVTTPNPDDYATIYDASAAANRKVKLDRIADLQVVRNSSGATANAGDVGYLAPSLSTTGMTYLTTTTANFEGPLCVVVEGAANGSDIVVTRSANDITLNKTTFGISKGEFLVLSGTAGQVTDNIYQMRPGVLGMALETVGGGTTTVRAKLLMNTLFVPVAPSADLYSCISHSNTDFVGKINGAPSGTSVIYDTITAGTEDVLVPSNTGQLAKLVLHNTTRGDSAYIADCDTTTNTITLTANAPAGWADNDDITVRSQTNTDTINSCRFMDLYVSDTTVVPDLTYAIDVAFHNLVDTGAAQQFAYLHPFEAGVTSKRLRAGSLGGASLMQAEASVPVPLINRRFQLLADASGSATMSHTLRLRGYWLKVP